MNHGKFLAICMALVASFSFAAFAFAADPTATNLSAAETYVEDTPLNLIDIVVSDTDGDPVTMTLTLSSPAVGSLTTGTSGAVTSTYNAGTGVWTASGAITDVNTLLAGVIFIPATNVNSSFTIATHVTDGVGSSSGSKAFTGVAVNDSPSATNLSAAETYTEDTPKNLTDIVISDVDSANVIATLTLSAPAAGSLSIATSGSVTSTYNAGTGVWTASGAVASVNTLLAGLIFTPAADYNSNFTIATNISDGVAAALTGTKAMTGVAVNDAPNATNLSAAETYYEDTPLDLTNIVVTDADSSVTATLTLSNSAAGALSTATSGAVTSTYISGTGVWTAAGAVSDVNTLLAGVTFTPASGYTSNFTISTSVSDGVAPAVTGSKAMTGVGVNSAPVLDSTKSPSLSTVVEGAGLPVGAVGTLVSSLVDFASPAGQVDNVTDSDGGAVTGIALTNADQTNATCYFTTNGGASWSVIGSVSGSSSRLLAADADNRLYCQPVPSFSGTIATILTFRAWDQTSGTDGGLVSTVTNGGTTAFSVATDTVSLSVAAANNAPVAY